MLETVSAIARADFQLPISIDSFATSQLAIVNRQSTTERTQLPRGGTDLTPTNPLPSKHSSCRD